MMAGFAVVAFGRAFSIFVHLGAKRTFDEEGGERLNIFEDSTDFAREDSLQ